MSSGPLNITLPSLKVNGYGAGRIDIKLTLTVSGYGTVLDVTNKIDVTLPSLQVKGYGAGSASLTLPSLSASGFAWVPVTGIINATLPSLKANGAGLGGSFGSINVPLTLFVNGYGAGVMSVKMPSLIVSGSGKAGSIGRGDIQLSSLIVTGKGVTKVAAIGHANITLPSLSSTYGRGNIELSPLIVSGQATSTLTNLVAYVLNVRTGESTVYNNYTFSHIFRLGSDYYGVKNDGLYLLSGADDSGAPIDSSIRTHQSRYGVDNEKRVQFAYLDCETPTTVTPWVDGVKGNAFPSHPTGRRVKLAKGYKGRWWQFEVNSVDGQAFKLGAIDPVVEKLSRKIP
jgi:hypothetical protein